MRPFLSSTIAACSALLLMAPATAANAAAGSRLKIATKSSAFYQYDGAAPRAPVPWPTPSACRSSCRVARRVTTCSG